MSIRQDTLMRQIEKLTALIKALSSKKTDSGQDMIIDQSLAELTGLDITLFADPKSAGLLGTLLEMLPDQNQKAMVASLLLLKDPGLYGAISDSLMAGIDRLSLHAKVKAVLEER